MYPSTTWELITSGKYIQTGNTPLSTGGSNSVSITKANLPAIKLQVNSFTLSGNVKVETLNDFSGSTHGGGYYTANSGFQQLGWHSKFIKTSLTNGTASPLTESLGSGTSLSIQPAYITLKFWKRLS
ncbi:MAG: hypothetical protein ACLT40_10430 [Fusobacterium sp.]